MSINLSPLNLETDYQQLADFMARDSDSADGVERLRFWNQCLPLGTVRLQVVATTASRRIVGFAEIVHEMCMPEGHFHFRVIVDKEFRGRGIGGMLYDDLLEFAYEQGARQLTVDVLVGAADGLRFAARRGFTVSETEESRGTYRLEQDLS